MSKELIHTITQEDVTDPLNIGIRTKSSNTGISYPELVDLIGNIQPGDVGKEIYKVDGVLQVENHKQRNARIAALAGNKIEESDRRVSNFTYSAGTGTVTFKNHKDEMIEMLSDKSWDELKQNAGIACIETAIAFHTEPELIAKTIKEAFVTLASINDAANSVPFADALRNNINSIRSTLIRADYKRL